MAATQDVRKVGNGKMKVWNVTLTVAAGATTASAVSSDYFCGTIRKIVIEPGTLKATATLLGYETHTADATGTKVENFLSYTVPNPAVDALIYPHIAGNINTGAAADPTVSVPYVVCDTLTLALAGANAADSVNVEVYVEA